MAKEVATTEDNSALPDYLKGKEKTSKLGNIDSSDLIIPRVKLMQKTSPELDIYEDLRPGDFYHTILEESIGKEIEVTPMRVHKSYLIWAPRGAETMILARASDGEYWDDEFQGQTIHFIAKNEKKGRDVTLGTSVHEHGLTRFGTSKPDDPNSAPVATLSYEWMFWIDGMGPVMVNMSRSGVKPAQSLISKIELRNADAQSQKYKMGSRVEGEGAESYLVPTFLGAGWASESVYNSCNSFMESNKGKTFRASDESDDDMGSGGKSGGKKPTGPLRDDI